MINKIDQKEKEYLDMRKRLREIYDIKEKLPWRQLDKPEHVGWEINFTLNKKGYMHEKASKWLRVIKACDKGYVLLVDKANLVGKIRSDKTFESIRHLFMTKQLLDGRMVYNGPCLSTLSEAAFKELPEDLQRHCNQPESKWNSFYYFVEKIRHDVVKWGGAYHTTKTYVPYIPEEYLAITIRKRMVTHVKDIDPKLISEEKHLDDKLEPYWRERGGHRRWQDRKVPRSRTKEAAWKVAKGEIDDITSYKKLNRRKW